MVSINGFALPIRFKGKPEATDILKLKPEIRTIVRVAFGLKDDPSDEDIKALLELPPDIDDIQFALKIQELVIKMTPVYASHLVAERPDIFGKR